MFQHKGTVVVYPVPFLCFFKEKNQKRRGDAVTITDFFYKLNVV